MNIFNYIEKYKNISFEKEKFNEIDNLIFSLLIYLDFNTIISNNKESITLYEAASIFFSKYTYKDVKKIGISPKEAYNVLKEIYISERYSSVVLSNYIYIGDRNKQFSALTYEFNKCKYIAFEGTDELLSGWKEDFMMAYIYPVPSQSYAINYLRKAISIFDKEVYVGGHSKGGNLALVSSMNQSFIKRSKIKTIYNNDGPGLRKKQIESKNYKRIKNKYIHIVPDYSYIGILLRDEEYYVVKSNSKDIMSHSMCSWEIINNKLTTSELSDFSKKTALSILTWLDRHSDKERQMIIDSIFNSLEASGVYYTRDIRKIKSVLSIIENLKNIDDNSKALIIDFLKYNINTIMSNNKEEKNNNL